jgi:hypothetical protein
MRERIGIQTRQLRTYRDLFMSEGRDWWHEPVDGSSRVVYRAEVGEVLAAHLRGELTPAGVREALAGVREMPPPVLPPPQWLPEVTERLTVASTPRWWPQGWIAHFPNRQVVKGLRASGEVVNVRVPDSRNFTKVQRDGTLMTLEARYTGEPRGWHLVGRCPRWPGRW